MKTNQQVCTSCWFYQSIMASSLDNTMTSQKSKLNESGDLEERKNEKDDNLPTINERLGNYPLIFTMCIYNQLIIHAIQYICTSFFGTSKKKGKI